MSEIFAAGIAQGSNIARIHALSTAIAGHLAMGGHASKGVARKAMLPIRAALTGGVVALADAATVFGILQDAGEGWEAFDLDEMTNKAGVKFGYFSGLQAKGMFAGKGEGSLSHLFNELIPADLAEMPEWAALPDRVSTKVTGPKGGSGVPATFDFGVAGIAEAIVRLNAYTAQHDVSFTVQHGVTHVKAGTKYHSTILATGEQSAPITDPGTRQELKGQAQRKAQASEAKLIWTAKNYARLKKATQGAAARQLAEYLADAFIQSADAGDAVGHVRPVWQYVTPAHRDAAIKALGKDGAPDESYVAGLTNIKVLTN